MENLNNIINGHEYIDLGLSVKWASSNIGASRPDDYGDYFAWGEISKKLIYTKENSVTYGNNFDSIIGDPQYDAARAIWGGTWRLPTIAEIDELISKCKKKWLSRSNRDFDEEDIPFRFFRYGYKVTGPNGNSIFLPAGGYWRNKAVVRSNQFGNYWTGEYNSKYGNIFASMLALSGGDDDFHCSFQKFEITRDYGQSIRPVTE